jgi:xanthine dehydrogenase molybdenum-binding subunit
MKEHFKPRAERQFVGTYRPRIDGRQKATGTAEYLDDIALESRFPGMLYAKVLRSPYAHARIKSLDTSKAEQLPGVEAILTYADPEVAALKPTNDAWTGVDTSPYDRMYWPLYKDRRVLDDHVRWVGDDAGVVVAAKTEEIAREALKLIEVEWEILPFVLDPIEAMKPDAPIIHSEVNPGGNMLPAEPRRGPDVFVDKGGFEKAFEEASVTVEASSSYHNAHHSCLDTRGCLALWQDDKLTVWTNYYQADQTRMHIANMLDLPLNKVRVICPYAGGSFGRGNTGDQVFFIYTAILARRTGRPIKFKYVSREDFHDTRNAITWSCKLGAKNDGTITSAYFKGIANSGAYSGHTMAALKAITGFEMTECMFAHIPNLKMEAYGAYTNVIPGSCMRGIGNNQLNLVLGLAVDVLAERLSMDPIELVPRNFGHEWEALPDRSLEACLREGAERIDWERRHKPGQGPIYEHTKRRGVGFSFHMGWHTAWQELRRGRVQVGVKVNPDLSVILEAPMVETGVGSNSCALFACTEALSFLGVRPEDIHWIPQADTERGYKDMVQTDSAVSYLQAELMPDAASAIKAQILELAAPVFHTSPNKLDIEAGRVFSKESEEAMSVKDLLWQGDMVPIVATITKMPASHLTGIPFAATYAEVEVDTETGSVQVLRLVVLNDCGTVMYASGAEAQQIGGQSMGLGEALTEEIIYDKATGVPLSFNWIDYKIPTLVDVPEVEPVLLEVWKGAGEYGACGIGEGVTTCTPRAIANAIHNATGARVDEIPITPWKVLQALANVQRASVSAESRR